ncbi:MAG: tRNA1(Val) (adenine(37)-N6)-methyltransferase [Paracoccaceae bacterium]
MTWTEDDLTHDAFLGGRLHLWQPRTGYRAGIDPVLLAAAVPARAGQTALDLGCGAGAAALCLAARVPGVQIAGVERQADYADLARRNAEDGGFDCTIVQADLTELPADLRQRQFDHVFANPPYFDPAQSRPAQDAGREAGRAGDTPLATWVQTAARRLAPSGMLHMIQRAARLPELLAACENRLGSMELLPLAPRQNRAAHLVILRARKGGRAPFTLHAPCLLHIGEKHERDADSYTPEISAVLRNGAALPWPLRGR